jgi:hydrogenase maturation protein HypF
LQITGKRKNVKIEIRGRVQGVGFRPFIFNQAIAYNLSGYVVNTNSGVLIEISGSDESIESFINSVKSEKPKLSVIESLATSESNRSVFNSFNILNSVKSVDGITSVLPDIATCPDCIEDIFTPANRRYLYPFTNCTNCGPRYSIIESLPYDRQNITMKIFSMCEKCRAEYENHRDRRFHAQPIACPDCGPHIELWDNSGKIINSKFDAIERCAEFLHHGRIVALKGLGGFQFLANARDDDAVELLRIRKRRAKKPLAIMIHSVDDLGKICHSTNEEICLLQAEISPIVLIDKSANNSYIAPGVAPDCSCFGVMLPYTPLHHLLMHQLDFPIVCTSGNISDEPIVIDEREAIGQLGKIADYFLVHNRPIFRAVDDSVVRIIAGQSSIIRSARGYVPVEIDIGQNNPGLLAVGSHLKNTIAITSGNKCIISQHIGDLGSRQTHEFFINTINGMTSLYRTENGKVICDKHPEYHSTVYAQTLDKPLVEVQHHYAHLMSCMLENRLEPPVLGIIFDGAGLGDDNLIWGGEFLVAHEDGYERAGHLRSYRLPGGDMAALEPRRVAISMLYDLYGEKAFSLTECHSIRAFDKNELVMIGNMLKRNFNCPVTSSMGRLFDAVSSLLGLCQKSDYEAEAAVVLESKTAGISFDDFYKFEIETSKIPYTIDWRPVIENILFDMQNRMAIKTIAAKFHNAVVEMTLSMAKLSGLNQVALTGGCFQNKYLAEKTICRLRQENFVPYWHNRIPANDGGISAGQIAAGLIRMKGK